MEPNISAIPSLPGQLVAPGVPGLPSRRLRWMASAMRVVLWLVVAVWLLFGLSWCVLHGWIVPRIGEFRPALEAQASKALGMPVRIGQITARSEGMIPSFELRDVTFLDHEGREALRLPRLLAALSTTSLWSLGFEQLYIDQPELDIRRAADGKIYVGGLDISQNHGTGPNAAADWFFSQREFVIRGGTVRWTDEMRGAPPLALTGVDTVVRNSRRRHVMRLDATPPAEWGDRFSVRGIFRQSLLSRHSGEFSDWTGQAYAEFARVDASRINRYASLDTLGVELAQGKGALRAWADVSKGKLAGGTADLALQDVEAKLGPSLEPLAFDSVAGRFAGGERATGFDFSTERLAFRTRDGLTWPGGNVALVHTYAANGVAENSVLKADKLDLAALAQIANRIPLNKAAHAALTSFAPSGLVESIEAHALGPVDAPSSFAAKGRVSGFSIAGVPAPQATPVTATGPATHPAPGRPGVSGAAIDFDFTQDGGQARVQIQNGAIDFPGVFEEPRVPMDSLSAEARWKLAGPRIEVQLRNLKFANADAAGDAQISWHTADAAPAVAGVDHRFPGVLDLQGALSRGNGAKVHRYLPMVLPADARHYVRDAVVVGDVSDVKFKVKGPIEHIPYTRPAEGDFRISAKVRNGYYAYVPKTIQPAGAAPWPAITDLSGELVFNHQTLEVNGVTGKVAGLPGLKVVKVDAKIPDLAHTTVEVNANLTGALGDALGFVNTSPVGQMAEHALATASATGTGDYRFRLSLPIHTIEKSTVEGTVTLPGNDVQFAAGTPQFGKLKGTVNITERGFNVTGAQAHLLGGDIRFEGGTPAGARTAGAPEPASVAFKAQGSITSEGLRQAKDIGFAATLAQHATGTAAYSATVGFRRGVAEVNVSSTLQGMALDFPAPLAKSAESALPVRFERSLVPASLALAGAGGTGQALQDQLSLGIGRLVSVNYVRDLSGAEPRVIRGAIGVGLEGAEAVAMPEAGVAANINVARVDVDAWERILDSSSGGANNPAAVPAGRAGGPAAASAAMLAQSYLPNVIALRARELLAQGRTLNNVVVGGTREGLNWRANVDASELNGYVEFRQPGVVGAGRVFARLSRLNLAPAAASDVEALLDEPPTSIPALDIVVDELELRGKKLGRVEIDAVNRAVIGPSRTGVREWRLNKFNVTLPEAVLTATGNWVAVNAQAPAGTALSRAMRGTGGSAERRRTVMNFRLDIADSGELLKRFGMPGLIRRGKGKLEGQVGWIGSPLSLDYPTMNGQFNVNIESGQFIKADPGIAKLLGVLSLQALPRRLALDFRDVFSEGFSFDFVRGDVNITEGLAYTNNLQMKGVNAAVLMEGNADIARETQSLKVVVVPEINAGTASLIATAINPVIGLSTFLAQYFLRQPLIKAATQEFHIDGTWSDPKITKLDRKAQAEARAGEASAETR